MATRDAASPPAGARDQALSAIEEALGANRIDAAIALARQAESDGVEHPLILNLVAFALENEGRFGEALGRLDRALQLEPENVLTLCAIGQCLSKQGRAKDALQAFDAAVSLLPGHAPAHHGRGAAQAALGESDAAFQSQTLAVRLDPRFPDPLGGLAELHLQRGEVEMARDRARQALALEPFQPAATQVLAVLAARENQPETAIRLLDGLLRRGGLALLHEAVARRLFADQLEKLGRFDEAFASYEMANRAMWRVHGVGLEITQVETSSPMCRRLNRYFSSAAAKDWGPVAQAVTPPTAGHVFLVGFVRSGTTLLEQVLASHPDVVALEEKPTLRALTAEYFSDDAGLDRLAAMTEAEAEPLRQAYWDSVVAHGVDPAGKVFVDKAPLSAIWQPLISRLFPQAKILFAIRDPRDVVVSCFRHAFLVNAMTGAFSDLEQTAEFYAEVMALSELYAGMLPLPLLRHRHEDLIEDFEGQARAICDFIGIAWNPVMLDFVATANRRDIRTPSADQVRQGLNRSGMAQWKRYEKQLAPVLPVLAPWIKTFGYDE
jgi:Flp pilus assembly protein TadD